MCNLISLKFVMQVCIGDNSKQKWNWNIVTKIFCHLHNVNHFPEVKGIMSCGSQNVDQLFRFY